MTGKMSKLDRMSTSRTAFAVLILLLMSGAAFAQVDRLWFRNFGPHDDFTKGRQLLATDSRGNCYMVAQTARARYDHDIQVMKFGPEGVLLWERWLEGTAPTEDRAMAIAVDHLDNLVVAGYVENAGTGRDALLVKLSPAGETVFSHQTNGRLGRGDEWRQLSIGTDNSIYVLGMQDTRGGTEDWSATSAIDARSASGELLWSQRTEGLTKVKARAVMTIRSAYSITAVPGGIKEPVKKVRTVPATLVVVQFDGEGAPGLALTQYDLLRGTTLGRRVIRVTVFTDPGYATPDRVGDLGTLMLLEKLHSSASGELTLVGDSMYRNTRWTPFVIRFNTATLPVWATRFDPTNGRHSGVTNGAGSLVVDGSGNCFIGGYNDSDSYNMNGFVARIGNTGTVDWQYSDPRIGYVAGGLLQDARGYIFAAGRSDAISESQSRLCLMSFTSLGGKSSLIDTLDASAYTVGGGIRFATHRTEPMSMALSSDGSIFVGGSYGAPAYGANLLVKYRHRK